MIYWEQMQLFLPAFSPFSAFFCAASDKIMEVGEGIERMSWIAGETEKELLEHSISSKERKQIMNRL